MNPAQELAQAFIVRRRTPEEAYTALKPDAPPWCLDAVREAHGDMLPDDWKYEACSSIASALVEALEWDVAGHGLGGIDLVELCDGLVDVCRKRQWYNASHAQGSDQLQVRHLRCRRRTSTMQLELKEKWVKALRSGKYRQGHGTLRNDACGYCCLGVLCDVSGFGEWLSSDNPRRHYRLLNRTTLANDLSGYSTLFGLSPSQERHLVEMNDTDRASFNEIANWIEENVVHG